jgi:uncharacterized protein (DUF3820 family)
MSVYEFRTQDVKGKAYVMVNERIKYFRECPKYAGWSIEVGIEKLELGTENDQVMMIALVKDHAGRVMATGRAWEVRDSSFINKTSFIENCETSAVGRALGFLGIGVDTSIATFEEVAVAVAAQNSMSPAPVKVEALPVPAKPVIEKTEITKIPQKTVVSNNKPEDDTDFDGFVNSMREQVLTHEGTIIPFGKYKGRAVGSVPRKELADWYKWLTSTDFKKEQFAKVCDAIEDVLALKKAGK